MAFVRTCAALLALLFCGSLPTVFAGALPAKWNIHSVYRELTKLQEPDRVWEVKDFETLHSILKKTYLPLYAEQSIVEKWDLLEGIVSQIDPSQMKLHIIQQEAVELLRRLPLDARSGYERYVEHARLESSGNEFDDLVHLANHFRLMPKGHQALEDLLDYLVEHAEFDFAMFVAERLKSDWPGLQSDQRSIMINAMRSRVGATPLLIPSLVHGLFNRTSIPRDYWYGFLSEDVLNNLWFMLGANSRYVLMFVNLFEHNDRVPADALRMLIGHTAQNYPGALKILPGLDFSFKMDVLLLVIANSEFALKSEAMTAIFKFEDYDGDYVIARLERALNEDTDDMGKVIITGALVNLGKRPSKAFIDIFEHEDPNAQEAALGLIAQLEPSERVKFIPILQVALLSKFWQVRVSAADALLSHDKLFKDDVLLALDGIEKKCKDPGVNIQAAAVLHSINHSIDDIVSNNLKSVDVMVQQNAVRFLERMHPVSPQLELGFISLLNDKSSADTVKIAIAETLKVIDIQNPELLTDALIDALDDKDNSNVRQHVDEALKRDFSGPEILALTRKAFKHQDQSVRKRVAERLMAIDFSGVNQDLIPIFSAAVPSSDADMRKLIVALLNKVGLETMPELEKILQAHYSDELDEFIHFYIDPFKKTSP